MIQDISTQVRPFNNDRMAYLTAFRDPSQEARARKSAEWAASPAPALPPTPAPRPSQLDEQQAESTLNEVQQEVQQGAESLANVHTGLDPQRVARLLGLLD